MAEAVGIALAIAPLIISALENYGKTAKVFKAFQDYTKHVKAHIQTLNIQEVIFRKANERFLDQCVGEEQARRMLQDRAHRCWKDTETATLIVERLSDSRVAFEDSIELIVGALVVMRTTLNELDTSGLDEKSVKKRIKYVFKQSNIEAALRDLARKTRDFVTLVDLLNGNQQQTSQHNVTANSKRYIARLASVQSTAQDLYHALGQACTKHTDHQAHLNLQPIQTDLSQVKFTVAFSHLSLTASSTLQRQCQKSVWLTVESQITGRIQSIDADALHTTPTQQSLKRALDNTDAPVSNEQIKKPHKKTVRIQENPNSDNPLNCDRSLGLATLTNLCTSNNFCNYLQKFVAPSQPSSMAIGYLELSGCSKHLLYIDSKSQVIMQTADVSRLSSLHHMLKRPRETQTGYGNVSLPHRLMIAHQLATAVLQFHSTPWLRRSWNSREVLVALPNSNSSDDNDRNEEKTQAYVSAAIHSSKELLAYPQAYPSAAIIRNMLLFRLGVMLLEIAFQSPLADLTQRQDRLKAADGNVEYFTADRLCRQVSAHMGFKYAEVTRKCIHCDFGCDFDLNRSKLQESFYQDVICELEKLEMRLKDI